MKTQIMVFLIPMLFHSKEQIRQLIWVIVLSIGYYGSKGGVFTLIYGGEGRVWGPWGSYIQDNNALAVAILMVIPLMRYLQLTTPHKYVKWGLTAMMITSSFSVLGSYSRGALLAVIATLAFLWLKGRHKLAFMLLAIALMPVAITLMPERWHERMDTIQNYTQEGSAKMRLNSWGTMWNLAKDRPIVGGGFEVASKQVYSRYAPDPTFPPQVAHSIYLQALGEHGFVGLGLFLLLHLTLWWNAGAMSRMAKKRPELSWAGDFGAMIQVTLVAFAVGGAFLSLVNFDMPYYLVGVMIVIRTLVERETKNAAGAPAPAARYSPLPSVHPGRSI